MIGESKAEAVALLSTFLAIPLWREFHEPQQPLWNTSLAVFLISLIVAAFLGARHIQRSGMTVGEARFTSTPRDDERS